MSVPAKDIERSVRTLMKLGLSEAEYRKMVADDPGLAFRARRHPEAVELIGRLFRVCDAVVTAAAGATAAVRK